MNKGHSYHLHVGTASILLVFVTLCLVSFSALTLSGANADYLLSEKLADRTASYYEAVSEAEHFIADYAGKDTGEYTVTKDFYFEENQFLRVTIARNTDDTLYISEYRVHTDESGMNFEESPFRVRP